MTSIQHKKILLATMNKGKIKEMSLLLGDEFETRPLSDFPESIIEYDEQGTTFAENAEGKALFYNKLTGCPTVADDSGLSVVALNGVPGVRSARWAGENATDEDRIKKLLYEMKDVPKEQRQASFICSASFADNGKIIKTTTGTVDGEILFETMGASGFGYDPVFYYPPSSRTFAEMTAEEKNRYSHRGKAFREIAAFIKSYFKSNE